MIRGGLLLTLGISLAGVELFRLLALPLPWLLGPMFGCLAAALAGVPGAGASACVESNVSLCPATAPLRGGHPVDLLLYNPLGALGAVLPRACRTSAAATESWLR